MDKLKHYQTVLKNWLFEYAQTKPVNLPQSENHVIIDPEKGHLQLLREGWKGNEFIFSVIFHFHIRPDGKIWVLANNTDIDLEHEFRRMNIPADDVVPGFQPEKWRLLAGYSA